MSTIDDIRGLKVKLEKGAELGTDRQTDRHTYTYP